MNFPLVIYPDGEVWIDNISNFNKDHFDNYHEKPIVILPSEKGGVKYSNNGVEWKEAEENHFQNPMTTRELFKTF